VKHIQEKKQDEILVKNKRRRENGLLFLSKMASPDSLPNTHSEYYECDGATGSRSPVQPGEKVQHSDSVTVTRWSDSRIIGIACQHVQPSCDGGEPPLCIKDSNSNVHPCSFAARALTSTDTPDGVVASSYHQNRKSLEDFLRERQRD